MAKSKVIPFAEYVNMTRKGYKIKTVKEKEQWHNRIRGKWYEHEREKIKAD